MSARNRPANKAARRNERAARKAVMSPLMMAAALDFDGEQAMDFFAAIRGSDWLADDSI